jgi:Tol biopolymer transport system component
MLLAGAMALGVAIDPASAQYFGRNKVNYEKFDFQVLKTEHFDIHFYPAGNQAAHDAARMAERWYERLSPAFGQEFEDRKPLILYSAHADFQQTNVIGGFLGEGTGGVTEPIKNRVIMPLTGDYAGTDHVLGHELVHVFQFDIAFAHEDSIPFRINMLPLWLVEGMAEYLSVGREDPHTAMWLRDAVLQDDFPTINQLTTDSRYFPYRYGQALWAYVGGKWGDDTIGQIYRISGRRGMEFAFAKILGVSTDSLSGMWAETVRHVYQPLMADRAKPGETGTRVLAHDIDSGDINLSPVLSPDGSRVAFLSERDLFSIDVFVADAHTGKIQKKLISSATNGHFDALRFIDSAGSWSPDGTRFALVVFARGNNELLIVDTDDGKIKKRHRPTGVGAISNPAWSPDGTTIAFSGSAQGRSDMYLLDVETAEITRVTDDRNAELQPAWSPDGTRLAFVTDRGPDTDFDDLTYGSMRLGVMELESGDTRVFAPLDEAKHINPQFSPDGRSLYFISDHQGFSDIYRLNLETESVFQVTRMATGVSGITALSPAMSVSQSTGEILFSAFEEGKYIVYGLDQEEAEGVPLASAADVLVFRPTEDRLDEITSATIPAPPGGWPAGADSGQVLADFQGEYWAGRLPPPEDQGRVLVSDYLADPEGGLPNEDDFTVSDYKPKLQLDYIGGYAAGGVAVDRFGSAVGGEATAYFSDMLGNHTVGVGVSANGSFKDIGAQGFYANRNQRWMWGGVAGHVPFLNIFQTFRGVEGEGGAPDTVFFDELRERVYLDRANLFAAYPFSTTKRVEIAGGFTRYSYDQELIRTVQIGRPGEPEYSLSPSFSVDRKPPPALNLLQASFALVGDNAFFGFTSPIQGERFRLEAENTFGTLHYWSLLADYRRYVLKRPFTLAWRGMHVGRYGRDSEDPRLTPFYLGYATFVRGYASTNTAVIGCIGADCLVSDRLIGSRIAVTNFEVRFPLIGTAQYGMINFPYLPTELTLFLDGGLAWDQGDRVLDIEGIDNIRFTDTKPIWSAGSSARVNLLGALILEAYFAIPFSDPFRDTYFGLQIAPGW